MVCDHIFVDLSNEPGITLLKCVECGLLVPENTPLKRLKGHPDPYMEDEQE